MSRLNLFIWSVTLLLLAGCISGPDVSRINPNDPESDFYYPKFSNLQSFLSSNEKRVTLSWIDKSQFNEGFRVRMRYNQDDDFTTIDTTTFSSYNEVLSNYSLGMEYEITSFYTNNNGIKFGQSEKTDSLNFGKISSLGYYSQNDTMFVQWFRDSAFDDRTTIKYKQQGSSDWETLFTILQADLTDDFYRTSFVLPRGLQYDFRVEVDLQNYKDEFETFYEREFSFYHR